MQTCPHCRAELPDQSRFCPFDGSALGRNVQGPRDPLIGLLVGGRYRIVNRLGGGGMALVYLADQLGLGRQVALKVMRPELAEDEVLVARFAREARAAARIDHQNVVAVLDFGRAEEGFPYLVMEQVSGRPLASEIARTGPFGAERALHILAQITAGVARAHALGIIHRDLKPANVMLCHRGSDADFVKILDFGLARAIAADPAMPQLTGVNELLGTPEYMPPERWLGTTADARSDLYAIGIIGYELLAGKPPFTGTVPVVIGQHVQAEPAPLGERVSGIPALFESTILRCLRKRPEERFESADELLGSLGALWRALSPNPRRATYAATRAARPLPSGEQLGDPTVFQSATIDPVWDGPSLCSEIRRLHGLRDKRLRDLAQALWGDQPAPRIGWLLEAIDEREHGIDAHGQEVAILETIIEEAGHQVREREAGLRVEVIEANVELTLAALPWRAEGTVAIPPVSVGTDWLDPAAVAQHACSAAAAGDSSAAQTTLPGTGPGPAAARLRHAERRLASLYRRRRREDLDLREELSAHISALRDLEVELGPLYEELGQHLDRAVPRGSPFAPQLEAFQKLDGAIASYQALHDALTEEPS